jgi:hypothetical protein
VIGHRRSTWETGLASRNRLANAEIIAMTSANPRHRQVHILEMLRRLAACITLLYMTGCISESGSVAVEKVDGKITPFPGLANLLNALPPGGSLNIFVTHGMSTSADESEKNLRDSIAQRLQLAPAGATQQQNLPRMAMRPDVRLDGAPIWPDSYAGWQCSGSDPSNALDKCDAPYLDVSIYRSADGKDVVFYSLNYWGVLVWLKCSQLVSADTHLIGDLSTFGAGNAKYCNARFGNRLDHPIPLDAVSSQALIIDHVIKNDVMDWGFPDAVIATSGYRRVLHDAVRAGLGAEQADIIRRFNDRQPTAPMAGSTPQPPGGRTALDDPELQQTQAYAIITESLGGYVLHDALAWATQNDLKVGGESIICRASQIHMLANQVSLLRLSRVRVETAYGPNPDNYQERQGSTPSTTLNCGDVLRLPPPYVVGYHDPSDLLSFYVFHPPPGTQYSFEAQLNTKMINVVAPFGPEAIPFALASPVQAHSGGQETDPRIQDMISFGSNGDQPNHGLTRAPDPPPSAGNH